MNRARTAYGLYVLLLLSACGDSAGPELSGKYEPQFVPGTPRYEMALVDRQLEFLPGRKVAITNTRGKRTWDYTIRGKQIVMKYANGDVTKHYSIGTGNCLLANAGSATLELLFCPV